MRATRLFFVLLALVWNAGAQVPRKCVVCEAALNGTFYWVTTAVLDEKQPICESCSKLETTCSHCRLPVRKNYHTLDDGRLLCARDYAAGVFDTPEALRIFEESKRDAQRILDGYGSLPDQNVIVSLANSNALAQLKNNLPSWHATGTLLGLTRTRVLVKDRFEHSIFLLSGLPAARLASVSAHEYTHAWMHENVPAGRKLDANAVEGFCELVAYKIALDRREETEKRIILANAYTRGQINAFVQAESEYQFHRIVHWMKTGVDDALSQTNTTLVLTLRNSGGAPLVWPPPAFVPTRVPEILMLKGISGAANRRFALINDTTLMSNETRRVRVGTSNLVVRCIEITTNSALVEVEGAAATLELTLTAK